MDKRGAHSGRLKTLCTAYLSLAEYHEQKMYDADDVDIDDYKLHDYYYSMYMKLWANHLGLILKSRRKGHIFS